MSQSISKRQKIDEDTANAINQTVCAKIEDLFLLLKVPMDKHGRCFIGRCPVHEGDNPTALNVYPEGYQMGGYWRCNTRKCHNHFAKNIIGFTRAVLSRQRFKWSKPGDKEVSFPDTLNFLLDFINHKFNIDYKSIDKEKFCQETQIYCKPKQKEVVGVTRNKVRSILDIPAKQYLDRGFSGEILNKYDVGLLKPNTEHKLKNRIIVPVYNSNMMLVGVQGRAIFDKCEKCNLYHGDSPCPSKEYEHLHVKWRNSDNFTCGKYLYNLWYAKEYIESTRTIILVEGPGDVWRLEQNGIHNAVALFGGNLTDQQQILIETSGATNVVVLTDYDTPGNEAAKEIIEKCKRYYNIYRPELSSKDVGEASDIEITTKLIPFLKSIERRF